MRTLTKAEWIAVTAALVIVLLFLGSRFLSQANIKSSDITSNINNGMNQNTNPASTTDQFIVKDIAYGNGAEAKVGNLVSVNYTGKFADGKVFDSSIPRGKPIEFTLGVGQVIQGWDQGIVGMKVGGKRTLTIPGSMGYGANGYPPVIPPNATLYFDVELTAVKAQ